MSSQLKLSQNEEMYLVTIHRVCEHCREPAIPIPEIAGHLNVQPVSVNQMIKKLAEAGLVRYVPYKGVELTPDGRAISTRILRYRRLWEIFLVKELKMDLDQADELACQFEHVTSPDVADRLSAFLGHPRVCYHGDPVPQPEDPPAGMPSGIPLHQIKLGQTCPVMRFDADSVTEGYLMSEGIHPGATVRVIAIGNAGDRLLQCANGRVHLSAEMVAAVIVGAPCEPSYPESEETTKMIPLSALKVGERGTIDKIKIKGALRQRLLSMGLVVGETILVKRIAPLGDPIDFVIKGYDLSLRKSEASEILVSPVKQT